MAQLPCISLNKPCINLPFGVPLAMYFDHGVKKFHEIPMIPKKLIPESSLKFEFLNHQKQTWGLKFDTLGPLEGPGTHHPFRERNDHISQRFSRLSSPEQSSTQKVSRRLERFHRSREGMLAS